MTTLRTSLKLTALSTATLFALSAITACSQGQEKTSNGSTSSVVADQAKSESSYELYEVAPAPSATAHQPIMMKEKRSASMSYVTTADMAMPVPAENRENYQENKQNPIHLTQEDAISTFSIDTDTGSYANVRRFLNDGAMPPKDAIRYEELINYFNYDFSHAKRQADVPFKVSIETVKAPWRDSRNTRHKSDFNGKF